MLYVYDNRNALNVVKDDLIGQVDELTGSLEIMKAELQTVKMQKESMLQKIASLEDDVKKVPDLLLTMAYSPTKSSIWKRLENIYRLYNLKKLKDKLFSPGG